MLECEIRFKIKEGKEFLKRASKLCRIVEIYSFSDHYFIRGPRWKTGSTSLRIREWRIKNSKRVKICEVLFSKTKEKRVGNLRMKQSSYGKLKLFEGSKRECWKLVEELEFKYWLTIRKPMGYVLELKRRQNTWSSRFVCEKIEKLGWWGEVEEHGKNIKAVKRRIEAAMNFLKGLGVNEFTSDPLLTIFLRCAKMR